MQPMLEALAESRWIMQTSINLTHLLSQQLPHPLERPTCLIWPVALN